MNTNPGHGQTKNKRQKVEAGIVPQYTLQDPLPANKIFKKLQAKGKLEVRVGGWKVECP